MTTQYFNAGIAIKESVSGGRRFVGTLYSGGMITDHPSWAAVAFDLQTLKVATPLPLLYQHRPDQTIGVVRRVQIGVDLRVEGELFTSIDERAIEVARKADSGLAWQMSVGIFLGRVEQIPAGRAIALNGRTMTGPVTVLRSAVVREASIVAVAADRSTNLSVFHTGTAVATFCAPRGYYNCRRISAVWRPSWLFLKGMALTS